MTAGTARVSSERGAIIILVLVGLLVLTAFLVFVVDYGIRSVSRNQAQNSADAGALAAAVSLAFDDHDDYSDAGPAKVSARAFALANRVFGESPDVQLADIRFSQQNMNGFPSVCAMEDCVRVDVFRNQARGNPLPVWFGSMVGLNDQGVRAMAIAWSAPANETSCMRALAVPDSYTEMSSPPNGQFDPGTDTYMAPGYRFHDDAEEELVLQAGPSAPVGAGWFRRVEGLIVGCSPGMWGVGDVPSEMPETPAVVQMQLQAVFDLDPDASWDGDSIAGGCVAAGTCHKYDEEENLVEDFGATQSPRVLTLPVFDPAHYAMTGQIQIVNMVGFFLTSIEWNSSDLTIRGRLVAQAGRADDTNGAISSDVAFLRVVQLVR